MTNVTQGTPAEGPSWQVPWTEPEGAARASAVFRANFGYEPTIVVSAPGRVTLIGEHTDYNGGIALPTVLAHRTFVAAAPRADETLRVASAHSASLMGPDAVVEVAYDAITPSTPDGWPAYVAGVLWALRSRGHNGPGLDLAIDSCVPIAAGLGSSAALECATALAAKELWGLALTGQSGSAQLAEACVKGERSIVGVPLGALDPYAVLLTEPETALMLDFASNPPSVRQQPLYFPEYGLCLLVVDTGTTHAHTDGRYAERVRECEAACAALGVDSLREVADAPHALRRIETIEDPVARHRARHVVTEIERTRLVAAELSGTAPAHERFVTIGKALYRSHASLEVDFDVSGPELNAAVDAAFRAGALGARLVGGGFGGAAIALVRKTQAESTARHIAQGMVEAGFAAPTFLTV
jgi:galactokinase